MYEIKRSIARKKIVALAFFTILIGTVPYFLLAYSQGASTIIPLADYPYIWVAGVFLPQPLFIQFVAILIAAGAMSEEYEQGTAELLLSKPVTKAEYFAGKYLGGYLLLAFIVLLNMGLAVLSASVTFGPQIRLDTLPGILVLETFSAILFYTLAFMVGELIRRSSLSYIIASALFFTSEIFGIYLGIIYTLTGNTFYRSIELYLPTSPVSSLPVLYASSNLPPFVGTLLRLAGGGGAVEQSFSFSILLILIYFGAAFIIALAYFEIANITRKVS